MKTYKPSDYIVCDSCGSKQEEYADDYAPYKAGEIEDHDCWNCNRIFAVSRDEEGLVHVSFN